MIAKATGRITRIGTKLVTGKDGEDLLITSIQLESAGISAGAFEQLVDAQRGGLVTVTLDAVQSGLPFTTRGEKA